MQQQQKPSLLVPINIGWLRHYLCSVGTNWDDYRVFANREPPNPRDFATEADYWFARNDYEAMQNRIDWERRGAPSGDTVYLIHALDQWQIDTILQHNFDLFRDIGPEQQFVLGRNKSTRLTIKELEALLCQTPTIS